MNEKEYNAPIKEIDTSWIRKNFDIPEYISDDHLKTLGKSRLKEFNKSLGVIIGNLIELEELKKEYKKLEERIEKEGVNIQYTFSDRLLFLTENAFVEGYYEGCCMVARATLEKLLQEQCMRFEEFKKQIEGEGRNPYLGDMMRKLEKKDNWSSGLRESAELVKNNGDWQAHHRLEKISQGRTAEDYRWGVAIVKIDPTKGVIKLGPDVRATLEVNRSNEARRMCKESLLALYKLFKRYRLR